jgi:hypothetical protein
MANLSGRLIRHIIDGGAEQTPLAIDRWSIEAA